MAVLEDACGLFYIQLSIVSWNVWSSVVRFGVWCLVESRIFAEIRTLFQFFSDFQATTIHRSLRFFPIRPINGKIRKFKILWNSSIDRYSVLQYEYRHQTTETRRQAISDMRIMLETYYFS